jgi:carbohydrate esterase-like sialic acid-specific acetylesterase
MLKGSIARREGRKITRRKAALAAHVSIALALAASGVFVLRAEASPPIQVYVFAGQSNMVGAAASAAELRQMKSAPIQPDEHVLFWGPTGDLQERWVPLQAPTELFQSLTHQGFGPEIGAAPLLARRHPDSTIAIFKVAQNATNLSVHWSPGNTRGRYRWMIERLRYAVAILRAETNRETEVAGFFWMQGESDSKTLPQARRYDELLTDFISAVRRDLASPGLPFVFGRIQDMRKTAPKLGRYSDVVREGQAEVARTVPGAFLVSTDGLERDAKSPIHFSTRGTLELGRLFASSLRPR